MLKVKHEGRTKVVNVEVLGQGGDGRSLMLVPGEEQHIKQFVHHQTSNIKLPLPTGTGLKIPPAAQQALQMTGAIPFGGMGSPAGEE